MTDSPHKARYLAAMHAMQSGIAVLMNYSCKLTEPKHLRVGLDSALVTGGALASLLIAKGVFTLEEYEKALADAHELEVDKLQQELQHLTGARVTLK